MFVECGVKMLCVWSVVLRCCVCGVWCYDVVCVECGVKMLCVWSVVLRSCVCGVW